MNRTHNDIEQMVRAHKRNWGLNGIELAILKFDYLAKKCYAGEVHLKEFEDGAEPRPSCHLTDDQAQRLMDDLWNCGLRPSEGSGSAGQLASVQQHLADMRAITFHKLGMKTGELRQD